MIFLILGVHFLFASTIIQFGPVTSDVLHTKNGVGSSYTQSGCKLLHYTTYGMRHVILAIIISLIIYAWMITRHNFNQEQLDKRIRKNFAWLVMLAFAIEAVFGMGNVFLVLNRLRLSFTWLFNSLVILFQINKYEGNFPITIKCVLLMKAFKKKNFL